MYLYAALVFFETTRDGLSASCMSEESEETGSYSNVVDPDVVVASYGEQVFLVLVPSETARIAEGRDTNRRLCHS